jgi:hypothetical protein
MTKANKAWYRTQAWRVGVFVLASFILFGSVGGAKVYYELYVAHTGVQLNSGKQLTRADLLDMVLISAVKQAQEQNAAPHQHDANGNDIPAQVK